MVSRDGHDNKVKQPSLELLRPYKMLKVNNLDSVNNDLHRQASHQVSLEGAAVITKFL